MCQISLSESDLSSIFSDKNIRETLNRLPGQELKKYQYIQNCLLQYPVNENDFYKRTFKHFYWVNNMLPDHESALFQILEENKHNTLEINFRSIMEEMHLRTNNIYPFLCSNIIHTVNAEKSIWNDNFINCFIDENYTENQKYDINHCINIYSEIDEKWHWIIRQREFKKWNDRFNKYFSEFQFDDFSPIKKIDLFFWKFQDDIVYKTKYASTDKISSEDTKLKQLLIGLIGNEYIVNLVLIGRIFQLLHSGFKKYILNEYYENNDGEDILHGYMQTFSNKDNFNRNPFRPIPHDDKNWDVIQFLEFIERTKWSIIRQNNHIQDDFKRNYINQWIEEIQDRHNEWHFFGNGDYNNYRNNLRRLTEIRNRWAHGQPLNTNHVQNALSLASDLVLIIIPAGQQEIYNFWNDLFSYIENVRECLE